MELVSQPSIIAVGEGMVELAPTEGGGWSLGYGGDVLNTAIHLAREGVDTAFGTALGSDPFSATMRAGWEGEGLDCSLVLTDPDRQAGLYAIALDDGGERSFAYWRENSAARRMFALADSARLVEAIGKSDWLYFSLITLAILPVEGRSLLLDAARDMRARGGKVAFDGNYRPRLWSSAADARAARDAAIVLADIGLPTLQDEIALSGESDADAVAAHWQSLGCAECVVKLGGEGCRLPDGTVVAPDARLNPVDTSGAGDAFNAGYLAARMRGAEPAQAARQGHELAGWTIMRPGAIPDRDADAPYA